MFIYTELYIESRTNTQNISFQHKTHQTHCFIFQKYIILILKLHFQERDIRNIRMLCGFYDTINILFIVTIFIAWGQSLASFRFFCFYINGFKVVHFGTEPPFRAILHFGEPPFRDQPYQHIANIYPPNMFFCSNTWNMLLWFMPNHLDHVLLS